MKKSTIKKTFNARPDKELPVEERRQLNRRLCARHGFTYIPMVGWMCRRENTRRKEDNVCGW